MFRIRNATEFSFKAKAGQRMRFSRSIIEQLCKAHGKLGAYANAGVNFVIANYVTT